MRELGLPSGLIQQMSCMALQSYNANSCNSRTSLRTSGVPTEIGALMSTYKSKPEHGTPSTTKKKSSPRDCPDGTTGEEN